MAVLLAPKPSPASTPKIARFTAHTQYKRLRPLIVVPEAVPPKHLQDHEPVVAKAVEESAEDEAVAGRPGGGEEV